MDIYSIGMLLYKILAGRMPRALDEITEREVMTAFLRRPLPPIREVNPDVPVWLQDVITSATARVPAERITTCEEFLNRL
jgi:serine/threonine protein kinase